jgi:hypothetical protein
MVEAPVYVVVLKGRDGKPRGVAYVSGGRFYPTEEEANHALEQMEVPDYGVFPARLVIEGEKSSDPEGPP